MKENFKFKDKVVNVLVFIYGFLLYWHDRDTPAFICIKICYIVRPQHDQTCDTLTMHFPFYFFLADLLTLLINGYNVNLATFSTTMTVNDTEIEWQDSGGSKSLSVSYISGAAVEIGVLKGLLSITFTAPKTFIGKTRGLLGVYNSDMKDDFTTPDGSVLPANLSEADIYEKFGQLCKLVFVILNCLFLFRYYVSCLVHWKVFVQESLLIESICLRLLNAATPSFSHSDVVFNIYIYKHVLCICSPFYRLYIIRTTNSVY